MGQFLVSCWYWILSVILVYLIYRWATANGNDEML